MNIIRKTHNLQSRGSTKHRPGTLLLGFLLLFPLLAALLYFVLFAGSKWAKPTYIAAKSLQFGFPILYLLLVVREPLRIRPPDKKGILIGLATGMALAIIILTAYHVYYRNLEFLKSASVRIWEKLVEIGANTRMSYFGLGFFLSILHALLEEYYWRWFVWRELTKRWASWPAIFITNTAFTFHHVVVLYVYIPPPDFWTSGMLFSLAVMLGGVVWSVLYRYVGSIYSAWASHAVVDIALMYIGYDLCRSHWP